MPLRFADVAIPASVSVPLRRSPSRKPIGTFHRHEPELCHGPAICVVFGLVPSQEMVLLTPKGSRVVTLKTQQRQNRRDGDEEACVANFLSISLHPAPGWPD